MSQISRYSYVSLFDGYRIVGFGMYDNCSGFAMRTKWAQLFGFIRPVWIIKRDTFEVGLEILGCWFTIFAE